MTGRNLFKAYFEALGPGARVRVAHEMGVAASTVHYWLTSTEPSHRHRVKMRDWSNNAIPLEVLWT